tara:strand:- start:32 stop:259 length:228 start_codon:yes stop_codon:yes gene_type:complete
MSQLITKNGKIHIPALKNKRKGLVTKNGQIVIPLNTPFEPVVTTGYGNAVMGVAAGSISTVMGVATANVSKVNGV